MFQKFESTTRWEIGERTDLDAEQLEDLTAATLERLEAEAINSHFQVGAALRSWDGQLALGHNHENLIQKGVHAEEAARVGMRKTARTSGLKRVTVVGAYEGAQSDTPTEPCGHCLQINSDLALPRRDIEIIAAGVFGKVLKTTLRDLLTHGFDLSAFRKASES